MTDLSPIYIKLNGQRANGAVATVSHSDGRLAEKNWHIGTDGYARRKATLAEIEAGSPKNIAMHREVLGLHFMRGVCGQDVDHIDGNRLNNCKENLRIVTRSQNNLNRHRNFGQSRFVGVSFFKPARMWRAYVSQSGARVELGYFATEEAAADARDEYCAAHIPGARLNRDRHYA